MKKYLFFVSFLSLVAIKTVAQQTVQNPSNFFVDNIEGKPYTEKTVSDIEGSPFLLDDWNWGAIKFANGKFAKGVPLRFNVYNNQLYFKKEEEQLEFIDPVKEFMIGYKKDNGDSVAVIYRSGYPDIDGHTSASFYEILADGKFQLVKYNYKIVQEYHGYNQPDRKKFADKSQLYAFLPDGRIVSLKKDKDDIIKAMPDQSAAIEKIADSKKLKLKSEKDIAQLFAMLNQQ